MGKIVGLTYDTRSDYVFKEGDPGDANAEFDVPSTIDHVVRALEANGHTVERIGNVHSLLKKINRLSVDIVFNICEGLGSRNRESQVPIILEMYGIPYVGSDGLTLGLTLDKTLAKKFMVAEKIPTPHYREIADASLIEADMDHLQFPLIVKPKHEGSSKGLSDDSRVTTIKDLIKRVDFIIKTYRQPALVEEFISGSEFTVGIIGNDEPLVLPPVQVEIDGKTDLGDKFYTFARLNSDRLRYLCPPRISQALDKKIRDLALKTYRVMECKDFGRVDFRVDEKGTPYVLEVNPLPSLSVEDVFMVVTKAAGLSYEQLIGKICDAALTRYGLAKKKGKR